MPKLEIPADLAEHIAKALGWKAALVNEVFEFEEDKDGYFIAQMKRKNALSTADFKTVCTLARDLGGDYVKGTGKFKIPGPYAKKPPSPQPQPQPQPQTGVAPPSLTYDKSPPPEIPNIKIIPISDIKVPAFVEELFGESTSPETEFPWDKVKGQIVPKDIIDDYVQYCINMYKVWPLFYIDNGGAFHIAGYWDMRRRETWCNTAIRHKLVLDSKGTNAFYDFGECLIKKEIKYSKRRIQEKLLQNMVVSHLKTDGWQVQENVDGVDVKALKNGEIMLVEAKRSASPYLISHALGQLMFAKENLVNAKLRLAIALPELPDERCQKILTKHSVEIIVLSNKENERAEKWKKSR